MYALVQNEEVELISSYFKEPLSFVKNANIAIL